MRTGFRLMAVACGVAALFGSASSAAAQTRPGSGQQGPLVLTPVDNRFVFSPDVQVTEIGHQTSTLVGLYMGERFDDRLFIGGGLSFLVDPHDEASMFYAGVLTGWRLLGTRHLGIEPRIFAGAGHGEAIQFFQTYGYPDPRRPGAPVAITQSAWVHDDFWMAEPKVMFNIGVSDTVRLNVGAGYRVTTSGHGFGDVFNGPTGTFALEFDIGR